MEKKSIVIEAEVQNKINLVQGAGDQLYRDIEVLKAIDANDKQVTGITTSGFRFRKLLNSIVIF